MPKFHRARSNHFLKIQLENLFLNAVYDSKPSEKKLNINYKRPKLKTAFGINVGLFEVPKLKKICTFTFIHFLVGALIEVQN